ncbi:recombinase family protein [Streptosporangium roseum]|uniref:recombinase family protein n=1 Tax=Streptosporangium roseum TaxID=2001 RepID=UPI000A6ED77A|nr:recombinase family protein [Streptosporangium roseum]
MTRTPPETTTRSDRRRQEVDRLGRNLLEGLIVLNDLFQQGVGVKVLEGIAAGEHTERSLILDLALALAEDRRRDIVRKTNNGLEAARKRGRVGVRRPVVDDDPTQDRLNVGSGRTLTGSAASRREISPGPCRSAGRSFDVWGRGPRGGPAGRGERDAEIPADHAGHR